MIRCVNDEYLDLLELFQENLNTPLEIKLNLGGSPSQDIIDIIAKLYDIEREAKSFTSFARYYYRKKHSKPILSYLRRKLNRHKQNATPNTPFYNAVQYALNHWIALTRYLAHGDLNIDNNTAERAIKPVVIGRKTGCLREAMKEESALLLFIPSLNLAR